MRLPNVRLISLEEFEEDDPQLQATKSGRTRIEYYFTCTPSLPLYVLKHQTDIDIITYLDSDLFFFSEPSGLYEELQAGSVLIVPHRFPPRLKHFEKFGIYNVGLLAFRNDVFGRESLRWWRERCIEWCYDRVEGVRFADQKYLDDWPVRFGRVVVLAHKGGGLGPWNLTNEPLGRARETILVGREPLVFYHFQGLRRLGRWIYDTGLAQYGTVLSGAAKRGIYAPYIAELEAVPSRVLAFEDGGPVEGGPIRGWITGPIGVQRRLRRAATLLLSRQFLVVVGGRVI
jgi:hypothetical protein